MMKRCHFVSMCSSLFFMRPRADCVVDCTAATCTCLGPQCELLRKTSVGVKFEKTGRRTDKNVSFPTLLFVRPRAVEFVEGCDINGVIFASEIKAYLLYFITFNLHRERV